MKNNYLFIIILMAINFNIIFSAAQEPIKKAQKHVRFEEGNNQIFYMHMEYMKTYTSIRYTLVGETLYLDFQHTFAECPPQTKVIRIRNHLYELALNYEELNAWRINPKEHLIITVYKRSKESSPWMETEDNELLDHELQYRFVIDIGGVNTDIKKQF